MKHRDRFCYWNTRHLQKDMDRNLTQQYNTETGFDIGTLKICKKIWIEI